MKTRNLVAIVTATLLISGCSAVGAPDQIPSPEIVFSHIHELETGQTGDELLVAAHDGLYRLTTGTEGDATVTGPIGGYDFDLMGFAIAGSTAYASGHPGPGTAGPFGNPNLGLIATTDGGETWDNVSLTGVTDFHALSAAEDSNGQTRVFGIDTTTPRIQRSMDGGRSWSEGAEIVARDILAIDRHLYATTPDGLAISQDHGTSFVIDSSAPNLYLIAAGTDGELAGIDILGDVWVRDVHGVWSTGGTVTGAPQAIALNSERIYVADDRGIAFTEDVGASWTVLRLRS